MAFLRIGHRGAPERAPENTLASFREALTLGLDGVELDVHQTRDGFLVVTHDEVIGRTLRFPEALAEGGMRSEVPKGAPSGTVSGGRPFVRDLTWAQIQSLDAGGWFRTDFLGERAPLLSEVLDLWQGRGTVFIELKAGSLYYPGIEENLVSLLQKRGWKDQVEISSFDHWAIRRVKTLAPRLPAGVLYNCRPIDPIALAREAGAEALHPFFRFVTPELIKAAHANGLQVFTWTVDDREDIQRLLAWGVDGIMTNRPEQFPPG